LLVFSTPRSRSPTNREGARLADGSPRHRKQTTVPNVVGDQRQAAMDELAASHLRGRFGSSPDSLICAGAAPAATVIRQFPGAGAKAPEQLEVAAAVNPQRLCPREVRVGK
jgi:hypothetical protein